MLKILVSLFLLGQISSYSFAADDFRVFVKTVGLRQGQFKGEVLVKGREGTSELRSIEFGQQAPFDPSTGAMTGRRRLQPVTITKSWGASSVQYFVALTTNEQLKDVRFDFYRTDPRGAELLDHSIVLTNASVVSFRDSTNKDADQKSSNTISFVYRRIDILDEKGTVIASDEWNPGS